MPRLARFKTLVLIALTCLLSLSGEARAEATLDEPSVVMGVKVRFGGRYDDVRMCVASDPGVKGGMAADISFFTEVAMNEDWVLHVDLPVMRPILFGAAFKMLQYEPSVSAKYRVRSDSGADLMLGPTLGLSLHYGPDYWSTKDGEGRRPDFFALGPMIGGFLGLDIKRPGEAFNVQLGVTPYVTPLFSMGDPDEHQGVVIGGLFDALFRWGAN